MRANDTASLSMDIAQLEAVLVRLRERDRQEYALRLLVEREAPNYASYARAILAGRLRLQRFLPVEYFCDPAFDMILDLFVATETGEKRSFKVSALASRVPPATASRYIDMMVRDDLVLREADPQDGRRTLLSLTPRAQTALREWLASVAPILLRRD